MTLVAALEEAELLCTVISGTDTDMIIQLQVPVPRIFPGAWNQPNDLKKSLLDNA